MAQDGVVSLGLQGVIDAAVETSEFLKIKKSTADKNSGLYAQTRANLLPHVTASNVWRYAMEAPQGTGRDDYMDYYQEAQLNASQVVWSFGKVGYAVAAAKRVVEADMYGWAAGKEDVMYRAKVAYFSGILARNSQKISEQSYQNCIANKQLLEKRAYGGRSSKYENIRVSAEAASRVPAVNEARAQKDIAYETIKNLIDFDRQKGIELNGDFGQDYADIDYEALVPLMEGQEPSLRYLNKSFDAARLLTKSARGAFLPTISIFTTIKYFFGSDKQQLMTNNEYSRYETVGFRVDVPIFEGGENWAKLKQAKADRDIAKLQLKQARKELLLELRKAYLRYQQYKDNLAANIEAVNLAQESYKQAQEMFANGQVSFSDLNDAELLLTNQSLNKEMTLFNINEALDRIEKLIAQDYDQTNV